MKAFFTEIKDRVPYEGPDSRSPLAYRYYDPKRQVAGRSMADHLRFAVCYWHTMRGTGSDPFGGASFRRDWTRDKDPVAAAEATQDALFELVQKLGVSHYCFHDRDLIAEGATPAETESRLSKIVARASRLQKETGVGLLWGTANLFSHPRYTHGAATNPDPKVFAHAATQVRQALDATKELGGIGYVFWGGREGYSSLLNTDMKREREQLARFLWLAVDYAREIGYTGHFFIEPKPMEPTTHQYDFDAATTLNFLREFGLWEHFSLNLEANHAQLAGHTFAHEMSVAVAAGKLGSLDINRGDPLLGWDTDQFPTDPAAATLAMKIILENGGLPGGLNFDAKPRRGSFDSTDLLHAHIGGIDTFARALLVADRMVREGAFAEGVRTRYSGWDSEHGRRIREGTMSLKQLEEWAREVGEPSPLSGREERLENLFNDYLYGRGIE